MVKVLKRNGRKVAFSQAKLKSSIELAAKEAGLSPAKRKQLLKDVAAPVIAAAKKKRLVKAASLRASILARLRRRARSVASAWLRYDRKRKKRK